MIQIQNHLRTYDNVELTGERFSSEAKLALTSQKEKVFVVGNQAGDLDTVVSALALAYLEGELCKDSDRVFVPLIPFARDDFRLRGDAQKIFEQAGFELDSAGAPSSLLFYNEVDFGEGPRNSAVMLTDHNKLHPG
jgi:exopolyphosphatase